MDEYTADAFANRDEPIPRVNISGTDDDSPLEPAERKRERLRKRLSPSTLKEKVQDFGVAQAEKHNNGSDLGKSLQDRLFAKLLQQVIPIDTVDDGTDPTVDRRSSKYVQRPAISLPVMTANFRRFNARIGIVFVFQNRVIRLFTWRNPTHTLSFLSAYTFVCIDPYLLVILPLAVAILFIMVPAFLTRHPPPPPSASTSSTTPYYSYSGPALAPPKVIKPAAETSKDFFRNMRDLQNSMADFTALHDAVIAVIAPLTDFSNEVLSSTVFLYLTIISTALFICAHIFPWRFIFLVLGYGLTFLGHPTCQAWLQERQQRGKRRTEAAKSNSKNGTAPPTFPVLEVPIPASLIALKEMLDRLSAISLDSAPEMREVEIFELQYRPLQYLYTSHPAEWQPHLYTASPYDPLSPLRISGDKPRGTRFFEDVQPPRGWAWEGKKWELDLDVREWVAERLITGVEFADVDGTTEQESSVATVTVGIRKNEEFGGWVWDLPPKVGGPLADREDEMWLAYGDEYGGANGSGSRAKRKKELAREVRLERDWEEGRWAGRTGEWRRRRWIRVVRRARVGSSSPAEGQTQPACAGAGAGASAADSDSHPGRSTPKR